MSAFATSKLSTGKVLPPDVVFNAERLGSKNGPPPSQYIKVRDLYYLTFPLFAKQPKREDDEIEERKLLGILVITLFESYVDGHAKEFVKKNGSSIVTILMCGVFLLVLCVGHIARTTRKEGTFGHRRMALLMSRRLSALSLKKLKIISDTVASTWARSCIA